MPCHGRKNHHIHSPGAMQGLHGEGKIRSHAEVCLLLLTIMLGKTEVLFSLYSHFCTHHRIEFHSSTVYLELVSDSMG